MGKERKEITELVCGLLCEYYRPGEKEELACRGYEVFAEKLAESPGTIARFRETLARARPAKPPEHDPAIERLLCASCPFREQDCDFMAAEPPRDAMPCGGYLALVILKKAGMPEAQEWLHENK